MRQSISVVTPPGSKVRATHAARYTLKASVIHSSGFRAANDCVDHRTRMRRCSRVRVDRPRHSKTNHRSSTPAEARLSDFRCLAFARGESLLPSRQVPRRSRLRKKWMEGDGSALVLSFSPFLSLPLSPCPSAPSPPPTFAVRVPPSARRVPRIIQRYQQIAKSQRQTGGKCAKRNPPSARYAAAD